MSELKYSKSGTPIIHLIDEDGKTYGDFIFSNLTKTDTGYKYICFTHRHTTQMASKSGKGQNARTKFVEVDTNESYVFNMLLKRDDAGKKGIPNGMIPNRLADWVKALLDEFTVDGVFPFTAIKKLEPIIADLDIDSVLVTEAERVRAAKKRAREKKRQEKIAAKDRADAEEKIMRDSIRAGDDGTKPGKRKSLNLTDIF